MDKLIAVDSIKEIVAGSVKEAIKNNVNATDSIRIVLENLRFISDSYKQMIASRVNQEWTILIGLISLCVVIVYGSLKFDINFKKRVVGGFFLGFAVLSFFLFVNIYCAHDKNQKTYLWADRLICQILNNHFLVDVKDNGLSINKLDGPDQPPCFRCMAKLLPCTWRDKAHLGRWSVPVLQWTFVLMCSLLSAWIIINEMKFDNKKVASTGSATGSPIVTGSNTVTELVEVTKEQQPPMASTSSATEKPNENSPTQPPK